MAGADGRGTDAGGGCAPLASSTTDGSSTSKSCASVGFSAAPFVGRGAHTLVASGEVGAERRGHCVHDQPVVCDGALDARLLCEPERAAAHVGPDIIALSAIGAQPDGEVGKEQLLQPAAIS